VHGIYSLSVPVTSTGCFFLLPFPPQQTSAEHHNGLQKHSESCASASTPWDAAGEVGSEYANVW